MNCGALIADRFCGACGQDHRRPRIETGSLIQDSFLAVTDVDSTFWTTFRALLWSPGEAARDYVNGKRRVLLHPVRYFLLALAFYAACLAVTGLKISDLSADFRPETQSAQQAAFMGDYLDFIDQHFNWLMFTMLPVVALVLRILFWKRGLNFSEFVVQQLFVMAQTTFVLTPLLIFGGQHLLGLHVGWTMLGSTAYQAWGVRGFVGTSWWRAALAYLAGYAAWMCLLIFTVIVFIVVTVMRGA